MRRSQRRVVLGVGTVLTALSLALAPSAAAATAPASTATAPALTATASSTTAAAVNAATAAGLRVAVAVTDTTTGTTTVAGEADALFPSESVVKVLIAARLLVDGAMTGAVATEARAMIASSDDDAANALWGQVGGPDVVAWAAERYGLTGLGAPSEWGWWGNTKVSAAGIAALYTALRGDPLVAGWLVDAMAATTVTAADGTDQTFGFGSSLGTGVTAVKQGWGGDDDTESTANLLSTGYLAGTRFAVAVIVQDPDGGAATALTPTVDALATAVVTDTDAVLRAETAAAAEAAETTASDEVVTAAPAPTTGPVGGASGPMDHGPWWPASVAVLGVAAFLGLTTAAVSAATRRSGAARPS